MLTLPNPTSPLRARPWRVRGAVSGLVRRLFVLCLAAVVLTATLGAGHAYLWCSMMQEHVKTCCCDPAPTASEPGGDTRQELRSGCCESKNGAALGAGLTISQAVELPAALPATSAPRMEPSSAVPTRSRRALQAVVGWRERPIRAGPRSAAEVCVSLQVFRC
jgi:hypothetical protein